MKKWFMRQYWRLQQSQTLISMVFWCTTLTLLIWPYVSWRFEAEKETFGIAMTYWGLGSIAGGVFAIVLSIGYIYDQFLALWKEQRTVDTERNPFGTYALIPANVVMIGMMNRLLRDKADGDAQVIATCDWIDEWLEWCSSQEIWARSQHFWDSEFESKVPDLFFLPDDAVEKARALKIDD
tara:strand:+ start:632 stop:1174 length:543 start_codon:yes stop_codon:yes gene_type:complete